ncbi:MAG: glycosyl transferase WecB/TagA/CpsF [Edaphobacter sp.]|nr:glycosyl transferase WecB/TagA/CpsF [Edaphobacter sp.]
MPKTDSLSTAASYHRILGIEFFDGTAKAAIAKMRTGGLLVVPAAPALKDLDRSPDYRESLLNADLAITDSAFMVLIWNGLQRASIRRLSGLEYLRELLLESDVRQPGNTLWIMASPVSARRNLTWLAEQGIDIPEDNIYMAPMYGPVIEDVALLERLNRLRPQHVIVTVGGGTQERLGLYLKRSLTYLPAIHCIGAAIAFLSGDQVHIPVWADKFYLGWLFRSLSEPKRYIPRYWDARKLFALMLRNRGNLPALKPAPKNS